MSYICFELGLFSFSLETFESPKHEFLTCFLLFRDRRHMRKFLVPCRWKYAQSYRKRHQGSSFLTFITKSLSKKTMFLYTIYFRFNITNGIIPEVSVSSIILILTVYVVLFLWSSHLNTGTWSFEVTEILFTFWSSCQSKILLEMESTQQTL